jgi:ABC-type sugar transport system permease subunit
VALVRGRVRLNGYAAAVTLVMFGITALIVFFQYRIVKRWRHAFVV